MSYRHLQKAEQALPLGPCPRKDAKRMRSGLNRGVATRRRGCRPLDERLNDYARLARQAAAPAFDFLHGFESSFAASVAKRSSIPHLKAGRHASFLVNGSELG